ncbi:Xylose operon regulatory protein [Novipirellula aureliae]|uniref:Xylose operon regulatory protein n=1 Tax=Novipirellula aureliae TaxID=2527966 RepID=A0A5C6E6M3_9BACT|nr:DNA-binding transcriptional regulator [Novipirellula aureliae]TWU45303.1 Xylose operon regulatory protein [Novipirellula aureliae]
MITATNFPNSKRRPKIALLVEASRSYGRQLLRGISYFARTQVNWSLLHQEMMLDSAIPDWMLSSHIDGIIARVDYDTIEPLRKLRIPIVDVRCDRKFSNVPQVETDNRIVAQMAFDHLWDRGFRSFAFCGFQFASYSESRLQYFGELVKQSGCSFTSYQSGGRPGRSITELEKSGLRDTERLSQWLLTLRRPTGMLVCNDIRGQQVLNVCRTVGIAVPDNLGVIGVDDDETICMMCDPPLSSVCPNAERVGCRAAEILHLMLTGIRPQLDVEYVSPLHVRERESTQVVAIDDIELAEVCQFIRQHACDGINVSSIMQITSLSRRQLERRFREKLGRTPHEQITETQIDRVKRLLQETDMTLEKIAPKAGYRHKESLSAVFKRETGQTPGEYRLAIRSTGEGSGLIM